MKDVPTQSNIALAWYFGFKIVTSLVGGVAIYLGYRLFVLGVTGQASLSLETHSVKGQLLNAAPALFFALGGVVILVSVVRKGVDVGFSRGGRVWLGDRVHKN